MRKLIYFLFSIKISKNFAITTASILNERTYEN